jgi:hypothetical protein
VRHTSPKRKRGQLVTPPSPTMSRWCPLRVGMPRRIIRARCKCLQTGRAPLHARPRPGAPASADSRPSALTRFWPPKMRTTPAGRRIFLGEFAAFSGGLPSAGQPRRVCNCLQFLQPVVRIKVAKLHSMNNMRQSPTGGKPINQACHRNYFHEFLQDACIVRRICYNKSRTYQKKSQLG